MPALRILFAASECVPFAKAGGLADVVGALPVALSDLGHDVRVVLPRYRVTRDYPARRLEAPFPVQMGATERWAAVLQSELPNRRVPVYLVEHDLLFDRVGIYGDGAGDFGDNLARFAFLSWAALALPRHLGWEADVLHLHDWQTALVAVLCRALGRRVPTVLTVHNLGHQGRFPVGQWDAVGLGREHFKSGGLDYFGSINLLQGGIETATVLSTVSARYAREIQTPAGGAGIDGVLRSRAADLFGIANGIDEHTWDPRTDPLLPAHYGPGDLSGKARCKAELQRELRLEQRPDVPLVGMVSRFVHQKGIDVLIEALEPLLRLDLQLAMLGTGEPSAEQLLRERAAQHPRLAVRIGYDERLAHRIEAGADLFLMPSRYEPCGLNQMYSQRYGTLPIVSAVGGLDDTVDHGRTGFKLWQLSGTGLASAMVAATDVYRYDRERFRRMQQLAMRKQMGWDQVAVHYEMLYRIARRRAH